MLFILLAVSNAWIRLLPSMNLPAFIAVYVLMGSLLWVIALNATGNIYIYPDSTSLIKAASAIVSRQYAEFAPGVKGTPPAYDYFSWYPFQTGALLWFVAIFAIFGIGNIIAVQIINVVLIAGTGWALQRIGIRLGLSAFGQRIEALLLMTSLPLLMSPAFVYTNTAGLFFATISLLAAIRAGEQHTYGKALLWTLICFAVGAIAITVKGTMIILLIAFVMMLSVRAFANRLLWLIPIHIGLFLAANAFSGLPVILIERIVQQRFGTGLPQLAWIAIGLSHNAKTSMPGWWSAEAIQTYKSVHGDAALQKAAALSAINDSLAYFWSHPLGAARFFALKLISEWSEPTYQTLYYSSLMERRANGAIASHAFYGTTNGLLIGFENVYQTLVYMFSAIGMGSALHWRRRINTSGQRDQRIHDGHFAVMTMMCLIFLGGFGCFLFWEAKSIYVLSFALLLIPVAAYGMERIGRYMSVGNSTRYPRQNSGSRSNA
ncbi:hypothetical protein DSM100688_0601 [Bifidobacterium ramosum]|nr:hypothetical protein DSM100688_0601 [Bifidobacterium ramosum]